MARRNRWKKLFPSPDEIVAGYLVGRERIIIADQPALNAYLTLRWREVIIILALFVLFLYSLLSGGNTAVPLIAFLVMDALVIWLIIRRLQEAYTRYVMTNFRVMRVSGIFVRRNVWIPWAKVTDLSFSQSFLGRMLGYATIRIESANEESGLKDLSDLTKPLQFHRALVHMISERQGFVDPRDFAVND
jgi:membrane protein YdbS with pleckstrin-like domain